MEKITEKFQPCFERLSFKQRPNRQNNQDKLFLYKQNSNARLLVLNTPDKTDQEALKANHSLLGSLSEILLSQLPNSLDHKKRCVRAQVYSDTFRSLWLK